MLALTLSSCTEVLQSRGQNKGWLMALPPARCGRLARPVALQSNSPSVSLSNRDLGKKPRARTCRGKGSEGIRPPGQRPRRSRAPEPNSTCDAGPKGQCPAVARRGRPSPRGGGREESRDTQSARGRALGGRWGGAVGAGRAVRPGRQGGGSQRAATLHTENRLESGNKVRSGALLLPNLQVKQRN